LIQDDELGKAYSEIGIFRLAPQDYHRFHAPLDAVVGKQKDIVGNLYTVNPMAVKELSYRNVFILISRNLNVFTQNKRAVLALKTDFEHPVLFVAIGAMLVGSIGWSVKEGQKVRKGEDMGYFAYGGSTVIVLFPKEMEVVFDDDMSHWSKDGFETVMKVGQGIAKAKAL
jgi:phosphatidylserine decarboxylase